jgi:hypothetical protein
VARTHLLCFVMPNNLTGVIITALAITNPSKNIWFRL